MINLFHLLNKQFDIAVYLYGLDSLSFQSISPFLFINDKSNIIGFV